MFNKKLLSTTVIIAINLLTTNLIWAETTKQNNVETLPQAVNNNRGPNTGGPGGPPPGGMGGMTDEQLKADTFVGVTVDGVAKSGLFPITKTGVSTDPITNAAQALLNSLTTAQNKAIRFDIGDIEWRKWSNVDGYQREGVSLEEMNDSQKSAAWNLMSATLSAKGLEEVQSILKLNLTEGELLGQTNRFNEELYWFTIMGTPSKTEPWGFQFDGHHLVMNFFILGDKVTMVPTFMGSEPTRAPQNTTHAGTTALQGKQDAGLALAKSLTIDQLKTATLKTDKTGDDFIAGAFADNVKIAEEGILAKEFSDQQKELLLTLIDEYAGDLADGHSKVWREEVKEHLDETYFAWIGKTNNDSVFYFRVYSPVILIEFDHQRPGPLGQNPDYATNLPTLEHIHSIIRIPNGNDYGKDYLRQHLEADHHQ